MSTRTNIRRLMLLRIGLLFMDRQLFPSSKTTLRPLVSVCFRPCTLLAYTSTTPTWHLPQVCGTLLRLTVEAPPATPTPAAETESFEDQGGPSHREEDSASGGGQASPPWAWILPALVAGLMTGGAVSALILRRRRVALPPRREGESPAERARQLQVALERWWLDARATARGRSLEDDLHALRKELEAVRFAPGRADHSETVSDLEDRLRGLMRRA